MVLRVMTVVTDAKKADLINLIQTATPDYVADYTVPLCALGETSHLTPPTHWMANDEGVKDGDYAIWRDLLEGEPDVHLFYDNPQNPGGYQWAMELLESIGLQLVPPDPNV